ncbi:MAG: hypothetical protein Q9213_005376 [Squamulea squamosa]
MMLLSVTVCCEPVDEGKDGAIAECWLPLLDLSLELPVPKAGPDTLDTREGVREELNCSDVAVVGTLNEAELAERVPGCNPVLEPLDEVKENAVKTVDPESDAKLLTETVLELRESTSLADDNVVLLLLRERLEKIDELSAPVEDRPDRVAVTVEGVFDDSFVELATKFDVAEVEVVVNNSLDRLGTVLDDIELEVAFVNTLDKPVADINDEKLEPSVDDKADNVDDGEDEVDVDVRLADRLETAGDDVVAPASVDSMLDPAEPQSKRQHCPL